MDTDITFYLETDNNKLLCHGLFTFPLANKYIIAFYVDNNPEIHVSRYIPNSNPFKLYNDLTEEEKEMANKIISTKFKEVSEEGKLWQ